MPTEEGKWFVDELEGEIDKNPAEESWTLGADGRRENGKESG